MVFERITLINIYDALKAIETNEKRVSSILINRSSKFGTKTFPRFENIEALKSFITENYPYRKIDNPECECFTCNEGLISLLNFSVEDTEDVIFVNNLRTSFESAKEKVLNKTSIDALKKLFNQRSQLENLFLKFVCYGYVAPQPEYWNPCEYTDFITNSFYHTLIDKYYKPTRRPDFPGYKKVIC